MLDPKFVHAQEEFARLKKKFDDGALTSDAFESALQNLIFEHEGRRWTIGASSGKWFASSGDSWVEAAPPAFRPILPEHANPTPHTSVSTPTPAHPATSASPATHAASASTPPPAQRAASAGGLSEKAKLTMLRWGVVLMFVGAVSFVLPFIDMQFQLLNLFGEENQKPAAIAMLVLGGILVLIGRSGGFSGAASQVGAATEKHSHLLIGAAAIVVAIIAYVYLSNQ